jgi:hypothetical protein
MDRTLALEVTLPISLTGEESVTGLVLTPHSAYRVYFDLGLPVALLAPSPRIHPG